MSQWIPVEGTRAVVYSGTMWKARVVRWVSVGAVFSAAGCGSDGGSTGTSLKCGLGTVESNGECVPQCGAGTVLSGAQCVPAGASGDAGAPASDYAGASNAGSGATANGEASAGDSGVPSDDGGSAGVAGSAEEGGSASGTSGTGGASGSAGTGGAAGTSGTAHWLTFSHTDGVFLYDTTQFPDAAGLVKISTHASGAGYAVGPFSPDGRWLAYVDGGDLFVRNVSGSVPGAPTLLLDEASAFDVSTASGRHCYWSPDSKTLAFVSKGTVYVLPVTQAVPDVHRFGVNATLPVLGWAPTGSTLAIDAVPTVQLIQTQAGSIVKATTVSSSAFKDWSPDGKSFVGVNGSNVLLTDVTTTTPTVHTLTAPVAATPSILNVAYNATGSMLAFSGVQDRKVADVYTVPLLPTLGARTRLSAGLDDLTASLSFVLSPNGNRIAYLTQYSGSFSGGVSVAGSFQWLFSDIAAGQPGAPTPFPVQQALGSLSNASAASNALWFPNGSSLLYSGIYSYVFNVSSVSTPGTASAVTSPVALDNLVFAGSSSVYANASNFTIYVSDLDDPQGAAGSIYNVAYGPPYGWSWSPDFKFIATTARGSSNQPSLTRVTGINVSTPVSLYPVTSSAVSLFWQPSVTN